MKTVFKILSVTVFYLYSSTYVCMSATSPLMISLLHWQIHTSNYTSVCPHGSHLPILYNLIGSMCASALFSPPKDYLKFPVSMSPSHIDLSCNTLSYGIALATILTSFAHMGLINHFTKCLSATNPTLSYWQHVSIYDISNAWVWPPFQPHLPSRAIFYAWISKSGTMDF